MINDDKQYLKIFKLFFVFTLFASTSFATEGSCFPIGMSTADRECYTFETQTTCQEKNDQYSCGWGKRSVNSVPDDEALICDDSRCSKYEDGDVPVIEED